MSGKFQNWSSLTTKLDVHEVVKNILLYCRKFFVLSCKIHCKYRRNHDTGLEIFPKN